MTFQVTPAQYYRLLSTLEDEPGVVIDQTAKTMTYEGITLGYIYDGAAQMQVTVIKKPFFYPESLVESEVTKAFTEFISKETV